MAVNNTNNKNSKKSSKDISPTRLATERQKEQRKLPNPPKTVNGVVINYKTHDGHKLTVKEAKFIDLYIETGNARQSCLDAGYKTKAAGQYAQLLLNKTYVNGEIEYRLRQLESEKIASAEEILQYFTGVMRGEIKDQFGLDTPLSERTKAAQELAKRKIDIVNRVSGKEEGNGTVTIKLDWSNLVEQEENGNGGEENEDNE